MNKLEILQPDAAGSKTEDNSIDQREQMLRRELEELWRALNGQALHKFNTESRDALVAAKLAFDGGERDLEVIANSMRERINGLELIGEEALKKTIEIMEERIKEKEEKLKLVK